MKIKNNVALVLFSKEPVAGKVKTRLVPALGAQKANLLYKNFLIHTISELKKIKDVDFMVYTNKQPNKQLSQSFFSNETLYYQTGQDLGDKMYNCLHEQLKKYNKVILLGADCPAINSQLIKEIIILLDSYQHALVPVEDGGYSLIASTKVEKELFKNNN